MIGIKVPAHRLINARHRRLLPLLLLGLAASGCAEATGRGSSDGALPDGIPDILRPDLPTGPGDGSPRSDGPGDGSPGDAAPTPPTSYDPCATGDCWTTPSISGACGQTTTNEDFSTGKYNVHRYSFVPAKGARVDLTLTTTAGTWNPALLIHDPAGVTVHDGERSLSSAALSVQLLSTGKGSNTAAVRLTAQQDNMQLHVFVTSWAVVQGGFSPAMATNTKYTLTSVVDCSSP